MRGFIVKFLFLMCFCGSSLYGVHDLSVCAIFQNEGVYFEEWIEFHKLQGVKHFYLYNNNSQDSYLDALEAYVKTGDVTLVEWPYTYEIGDHEGWIKIQCGAYMHCIKTYGTETQWLAAIDIDEFLFCPGGEKLSDYMKAFKKYGGLCVNWIKFGTSDVEEIPSGICMIELLTRCLRYDDKDNLWIKSIVQPQFVVDCLSPHVFLYKEGKFAVDVDKEKMSGGRKSKQHKSDKIRINHYWTRTVSYFLKTKIAGRQERRPNFSVERLMGMAKECNECEDLAILRYVEELRKALGHEEVCE